MSDAVESAAVHGGAQHWPPWLPADRGRVGVMAAGSGFEPVLIAERYQVLEKLGAGGFGSVFKANDTKLGRVVAVKLANPGLLTTEKSQQQFQREARAAAALHHPSIVAVHYYDPAGPVRYANGFAAELPFIVMEYIQGPSLRQLVRGGPLAMDWSVKLVLEVLAALGAAHSQGVWHRDIKPANIIVPETGPAKVIDFGIAKVSEATSASVSEVFASVPYASPEQLWDPSGVDGRSDLYSAGCVLYELLTGRTPFRDKDLRALAYALLHALPTPPADLDPALPQALSDAIIKALAKDPADRWQTAADFAGALTHAIWQPEPSPAPIPAQEQAPSDGATAIPLAEPAEPWRSGGPAAPPPVQPAPWQPSPPGQPQAELVFGYPTQPTAFQPAQPATAPTFVQPTQSTQPTAFQSGPRYQLSQPTPPHQLAPPPPYAHPAPPAPNAAARSRRRKRAAVWAVAAVIAAAATFGATQLIPLLRDPGPTKTNPQTNPRADPTSQNDTSTSPQTAAALFVKTLGGTAGDAFLGVAVMPDGGLAAVGGTECADGDFGPSKGEYDAVAARFGLDGGLLWSKTLGGAGLDVFNAVAALPDGGLAAAGQTDSTDGDFSPSKGQRDAVLARFAPNGDLLWSQNLDGSEYGGVLFNAVAATPDGGLVAAGHTGSIGMEVPEDEVNAVLARFGPNGDLLWSKTHAGAGLDEFRAVAVMPDGGLAAAGDTTYMMGQVDAILARFDSDGELIWSKTFGDSDGDDDVFYAVAATPDGGLAVAGLTESADGVFEPSEGEYDALMARFGPDGELLWSKTLGGANLDGFDAVAVAPDGGLAAAGYTESADGDFGPSGAEYGAVVARFGSDGKLIWSKTLGGGGFSAIVFTPDGGLAAVGAAESADGDFGPFKGGGDAILARFGPDGQLEPR